MIQTLSRRTADITMDKFVARGSTRMSRWMRCFNNSQ